MKTVGHSDWAGWHEYFRKRRMRHSPLTGETFDNYVQAVQAALDGRGLMLGWRSVTGRLEHEGSLVAWPNGAMRLGTAYYLTMRNAHSNATTHFVQWLTGLEV